MGHLYKKAYPWLVFVLSTLFLFYKYALEVSPSVMASHLMGAYKIDGAMLGNLAGSYFYSYLLMQIPAGLLIDRFGPKKVTSIAIFLCALGSLGFGLSEGIYSALFFRFLTGLGASFSAINCLKITANWFPIKKFAFMAGLMMSIGMMGAVFGGAPLSLFINFIGWRASLEIIGYVGIALALLFYFFVKDHPDHQKDVRVIPRKEEIVQVFKDYFTKAQPWLLSIYSGLAFAPVSVFGGLWGVPFLMQYANLSKEGAAHEISYIFIGFAVGAPLWGYISDLIRSRKIIMYFGTFFSLIFMLLVLYKQPNSVFLLGLFLFLFGVSISTFLLSFTMIKELIPPIFAATAIGFMNTFDAFIGAVSDPLTGKILDFFWKGQTLDGARVFSLNAYFLSLSVLPIYLFVSFITLFFIKETYSDESYPSCLP